MSGESLYCDHLYILSDCHNLSFYYYHLLLENITIYSVLTDIIVQFPKTVWSLGETNSLTTISAIQSVSRSDIEFVLNTFYNPENYHNMIYQKLGSTLKDVNIV
jgi:hypothetical protein